MPKPSGSKRSPRPSRTRPGPASGTPSAKTPGVVVFDMDGTIFDDMGLIGRTAAEVIHEAFGTPLEEARRQYFQTTGKPFELQLQELYPDSTPYERLSTAQKFHQAKVTNAYAHTSFFPEMPRVLKQLDREGWILVISTGAEREMAQLLLEREGLAFFFREVLGAAQGTKVEHLKEYRRRWPGLPLILVGDSRFDMEAAREVPGTMALGRACLLPGWTISPADLIRWGARWADYHLEELPQELQRLIEDRHHPASVP